MPDQSKAKIKSSTSSKKPSPSESPAEEASTRPDAKGPSMEKPVPKDSLRMTYSLKVTSDKDTVVEIENTITLFNALTHAMQAYTPEQFKQQIENGMLRPALINLSAYMAERLSDKQETITDPLELEDDLPESPPIPKPEK